MMQKIKKSISSEIDKLVEIETFIESFITTFELPPKLLGKISLSLIEATANAILYGNKQDATKIVTVVAERIDNQFRVTVSDEGEGFDYTIIPNPTLLENIGK